MKAVFLDRNTLSSHMELSVPQGVTQWLVYESTRPEEVITHLAEADIAITNKVKIRREHLEQLPQLKLIQLTATGMDNIDTEAAKELGVTVRNVVGYSTESVAEHFFMLSPTIPLWRQEYGKPMGVSALPSLPSWTCIPAPWAS